MAPGLCRFCPLHGAQSPLQGQEKEAERPRAMFVVVLARGASRGIIPIMFFTRRPSCGPAAWRYFTRLVQSDQTWAYRRNVFTSPALRNMQFFKTAPYKNKRFQEASTIKTMVWRAFQGGTPSAPLRGRGGRPLRNHFSNDSSYEIGDLTGSG